MATPEFDKPNVPRQLFDKIAEADQVSLDVAAKALGPETLAEAQAGAVMEYEMQAALSSTLTDEQYEAFLAAATPEQGISPSFEVLIRAAAFQTIIGDRVGDLGSFAISAMGPTGYAAFMRYSSEEEIANGDFIIRKLTITTDGRNMMMDLVGLGIGMAQTELLDVDPAITPEDALDWFGRYVEAGNQLLELPSEQLLGMLPKL
jgi:hypothetical protein